MVNVTTSQVAPKVSVTSTIATGKTRINRALADALALDVTETFTYDAPPSEAERALSPEEKLLRAIFGERGERANEMVEVGQTVARYAQVFFHAENGVSATFMDAPTATVTRAETVVNDLTPGITMRMIVDVSWRETFTAGDRVVVNGEPIAIEEIVDDGQPPRIECQVASAGVVTRVLPTAQAFVFMRSIGPYDTITQQPASGFGFTAEQLDWLHANGGDAILSDYAGHRTGDALLRTRIYETLVKGESVANPYMPYEPPAPPKPATSGGMDIFSFFEKPSTSRGLDQLRYAQLLARVAGLVITRTEGGLQITVGDPDDRSWSAGPILDDLYSQKLFGPKRDYECGCGKYNRMKHRGVVCEKCGVEVIQSRVRRERIAHLELIEPYAPRAFPSTKWSVLPVLPPDLRDPTSDLNQAYERVMGGDLESVSDAVDLALESLVEWLAYVPQHGDYSAESIALVGERDRASGELLAELFMPSMYGACEAAGLTTTIKSAKRLIRDHPTRRDQLLREMVLPNRWLLVGTSKAAALAPAQFDVADSPVIELSPATAAQLGVRSGDRIRLHVPLSNAAQHVLATGFHATPVSHGPSWIRDVAERGTSAVLGAAQGRATDPCTWPRAALLVGGYPYTGDEPEIPFGALTPDPAPEPAQNPYLDRSVDELELSVRTANCLQNAQVRTIRELVQRTEADLLKERNFARKSLKEVKEILAEMGLSLGMKL
ncbi:MAG: DNA-directed RNA polymerase subunit alpha C-terminal domain-containing protein [Kofleriaceae bacterium]